MDDAALQLPDDPQVLKRIIAQRDLIIAQERVAHAALLGQRDETIGALREDNALLQHRLNLLLRASYGPRAERFDPRQLLLFGLRVPPIEPTIGEVSTADPSDLPVADTGTAPAPRNRKPHGRRKLPDHLPRIRIEHDLEESERSCPCCCQVRHKIGEEITNQLEYIPSSLVVLQHARLKYACKNCNSGSCPKCDGQAHIDIADKPHQPIERGLAGPGLLAYVITSKLADHLPLYRIQQIFARQQVPWEVEILVAEVGPTAEADQLFHILYDGTVLDERQYSVLGGDAEAIGGRLSASYVDAMTLADVLRAATKALAGPERTLAADDLEVAVLARGNGRRCFRRLPDDVVATALQG